MLMTARAQAQNSADAGALAGAVALVFDDYNDRTPTGPAVTNAVGAASSNQVMRGAVSVTPADVVFLNDPATGESNRVQVTVYRRADRGNPMQTFVARYFGVTTVGVAAQATAEASPADAATCVKPWAIPDKWQEIQTPAWDEGDDYDYYVTNGGNVTTTPLPNPDIYNPITAGPSYTGYRSNRTGPDYGRRIVLKEGNPNQAISASQFYPLSLPGGSGGSWYEDNIPGCWPGIMEIGDQVPLETGNKQGPTHHGTESLIAQDPTASWAAVNRRVVSPYSPSPRVVHIPVFDPYVWQSGRAHGNQILIVANIVAFFVEDVTGGGDVIGYMVPSTGLRRGNPGAGAYLRAIRLVQ
jgi:hypothetical protein